MNSLLTNELPRGPGTYVLVMQLDQATSLVVGRLGIISFEAGWYLYVGSALGGLGPRLARHLRMEKRHHWHIDYLLDEAHIVEIWLAEHSERIECQWAEALGTDASIAPICKGFGASDCHCVTHLFYTNQAPTLQEMVQALDTKRPVRRWRPSQHGQQNNDSPILD